MEDPNEMLNKFLDHAGVESAYGMLKLKDGNYMLLNHNANLIEMAGMMYALKKRTDVHLTLNEYEQIERDKKSSLAADTTGAQPAEAAKETE